MREESCRAVTEMFLSTEADQHAVPKEEMRMLILLVGLLFWPLREVELQCAETMVCCKLMGLIVWLRITGNLIGNVIENNVFVAASVFDYPHIQI